MIGIQNFQSKKFASKSLHRINVNVLPMGSKANAGKDILPPRRRIKRNRNRTTKRYLKSTGQWLHKHNGFYNDTRGSPYLLLSESDTLVNQPGTIESRPPICHSVLHEPPLLLDPVVDVEPLAKGIRLSICVEHTHFPLVGRVSKSMGLTHVPEHRLWNVQWCDNTPHYDLLKSMKRFQQINHFPGMSEICRKDLLSRNLNRMLKLYPEDYKIFPKTWLLPTDTYDVSIYASKHKHTFILKPYSSGQGRGIWLTNNLRTVRRQEKLICQTYVEKPLLIDGFKFDLRVYTLVTSVDPLRIYVYNEGLARFATNKYKTPALGNSTNLFMHLTNYCVNRRNSLYDAGSGEEGGSKRKFSAFNKWLEERGYDVDEFWATVDDAIIKTVISAWPVLKHNYSMCFPRHDKIQACFQLLGFDILVDWKLKPYILEVNHTPSLSGTEKVDNEVKRPLIRDTLNLISTPLVDKEEIIREDRAMLRERLMKQAGRRRVVTPNKILTPQRIAGGQSPSLDASVGALAQQIAWEESHLGNYRRVMPPTDSTRLNYYLKFYNQLSQVSMYKETSASRSRHRLNHDRLTQAKEQSQANSEQSLLKKEQQMNVVYMHNKGNKKLQWIKVKHQEGLNMKPSTQNVAKKKKALMEKISNIQPVEVTSFTQNPNVIELSNSVPMKTPGNWFRGPHKRKCAPDICKDGRQSHNRHMQRRSRHARRLEMESRLDAEFLAEHSIKRSLNERLIGGISKISLGTKQKPKKQLKLNRTKAPVKDPPKPKQKLVKKLKVKTKSVSTVTESNSQNPDWLPQSINDADNQNWRSERSAIVNETKFKELLFQEMYEHGDLTKNDIKHFPNLLYGILSYELRNVSYLDLKLRNKAATSKMLVN